MKYLIAAVIIAWIVFLFVDSELAIVSLVSGASMVVVNIIYHRWEKKNKETEG
ncbi:MAG: hypothetical protein JXN64_00335 [Spirochaetes bacterium]|nr:hypothetical protein [Spirochaetota bacterium]